MKEIPLIMIVRFWIAGLIFCALWFNFITNSANAETINNSNYSVNGSNITGNIPYNSSDKNGTYSSIPAGTGFSVLFNCGGACSASQVVDWIHEKIVYLWIFGYMIMLLAFFWLLPAGK